MKELHENANAKQIPSGLQISESPGKKARPVQPHDGTCQDHSSCGSIGIANHNIVEVEFVIGSII